MRTEQVNLRLPKDQIKALKIIAQDLSKDVGEVVSYQDVIRMVLNEKFNIANKS